MTIRRYDPADAPALEALGGFAARLGKNIPRWLDKGFTKPEFCHVFLRDGTVAGGVVWAEFEPGELGVLDFCTPDLAVPEAAALLRESIALAKPPSCRKICYNLYNDNELFAPTKAVFLAAGFSVAQEKKSFSHRGAPLPPDPGRLAFKPLSEVGEALFVDMVERVTVGSLDSDMAAEAAQLGGAEAARLYVEGLKGINPDTALWRLGYAGDTPVGLVVPQRLGKTVGAINYIGVVPEQRGHGYGLDLILSGTRALAALGLSKVIADIDRQNHPMEAALTALGYEFDCEEVVLGMTV